MKIWIEHRTFEGQEQWNIYRKATKAEFEEVGSRFLIWCDDDAVDKDPQWFGSSIREKDIAKLPSVEV